MSEIRSVAVAGASGGVGAQVLKSLLTLLPDVKVTVLTRTPNSHTFPSAVSVKAVDYASLESLTAALEGQDAVINTTYVHDPSAAKLVVDAAVAARVRRYIPADFGMGADNPNIAGLPVFAAKEAVYQYVKEKVAAAAGHGHGRPFSYTLVSTGPFLDLCLRQGFFGIDIPQRRAELFDDGANPMPTTTLADVGRATANVLLHPDETANRVVYVATIRSVSQRRLLELAQEAVGGDWTVETVDIQKRFDDAMSSLKAGKFDMSYIKAQIFYAEARKDYQSPWEKDDNELLGIEQMGEDDIKELIKGMV